MMRFRQLVAIGVIVRLAEKGLLAPVAALRDMMGEAGDNHSCKAGHRRMV
jgi:hypothetical protein